MSEKHWFIPKCYGWGFIPVSWEGFLLTLALIGLLLISVYTNGFFGGEPTLKETLRFILDTAILTSIFSLIAIKKTKGTVKFYWGNRPD